MLGFKLILGASLILASFGVWWSLRTILIYNYESDYIEVKRFEVCPIGGDTVVYHGVKCVVI